MSSLLLNHRDWTEVCRILSQCIPEYTVWAFGSRVTGNVKPYSDLDLVVLTDQPLKLECMASLKDAFDESDLPIRVDVVDWAATSAAFREIIEQNYVVIQQGGGTNRQKK
ncbi:MAG: nucleotidyltransferase family protein [Desulfuromonadaceae bacterium]